MEGTVNIIIGALLLTCVAFGHSQIGVSFSTSSFYTVFHISNLVNEDIVMKEYKTSSVLGCAVKCSGLSALSFYHVDAVSRCYCNQLADNTAVRGSSGITYGYRIGMRTGSPSECQSVYDQGCRSHGVYTLIGVSPFFCNFSSLNWTVFQRRQDGSVDFNRSWTEYVDGFGDENGEFWMGLETIHQLTKDGCELNIYVKGGPNDDTQQVHGWARYSTFSIGGADTNYALHVTGFSGNIGDCLSSSDGMGFSTFDVDNDAHSGNCVQYYNTCGWWMKYCYRANLNGVFTGGRTGSNGYGIIWKYPWGYYYSLWRAEMAFRC